MPKVASTSARCGERKDIASAALMAAASSSRASCSTARQCDATACGPSRLCGVMGSCRSMREPRMDRPEKALDARMARMRGCMDAASAASTRLASNSCTRLPQRHPSVLAQLQLRLQPAERRYAPHINEHTSQHNLSTTKDIPRW